MNAKTFTATLVAGFLLAYASSAQTQSSAVTTDSGQETQTVDLEAAKREYHQKVMNRAQAKLQAKEAKAAAKEAKLQEMEALEEAKIAERQLKLEARAKRKEEKKSNRKPQPVTSEN